HHIEIDDVEKILRKNMKIEQKLKDILSVKKNINDPNELSKNAINLLEMLNENREKVIQMLYSNNDDEEMETMLAILELIYSGFLQLRE
ncbi:hypothetical protein, partial [uncultured Clostridium sp.]|uniref:hypothetical protein n=1 Tax=uncultured Clostridium sp. TaxID=59620 RepID=UPI00272DA553